MYIKAHSAEPATVPGVIPVKFPAFVLPAVVFLSSACNLPIQNVSETGGNAVLFYILICVFWTYFH